MQRVLIVMECVEWADSLSGANPHRAGVCPTTEGVSRADVLSKWFFVCFVRAILHLACHSAYSLAAVISARRRSVLVSSAYIFTPKAPAD
jgi:hypothetical protein